MSSSEAIHFDNIGSYPDKAATSSLQQESLPSQVSGSVSPASLIRTHEVDSSDAAQSTSAIKKLRLKS